MNGSILKKLNILLIVAAFASGCGNSVKFNDSFAKPDSSFGGMDPDPSLGDRTGDGSTGGGIGGGSTGGSTGGGSTGGGNNGSTGPVTLDESFTAVSSSAIDILFVDDDSGSMTEDQRNIASKFPNFLSELSGLDWRIAITTPNIDSGSDGRVIALDDGQGRQINNRFFLSPALPDAQASFEHSIQRSATGSGFERSIQATLRALQKRNENPNNIFFRPNTPLAVVIISDEDENSNAYGRNGTPVPAGNPKWSIENEPSTLISYAQGISGLALTVHAIAIPPGDQACLDKQASDSANTAAFEGKVYSELVSRTGGMFGSICSSDFTQTLKSLGQGVKGQLTSFALSQTPNPSTVRVGVSPSIPGLKWNLSGNKIFFNMALPSGTTVRVVYSPL